MKKTRIGLIFGGKSAEHEIAVVSAIHTLHFIDQDKYGVIPIYVSKEGFFYTGNELLRMENYRNIKGLEEKCRPLMIKPGGGNEKGFVFADHPNEPLPIDIMLPVFHGPNGEDGSMQGLFELVNVPYTSCPVLASAICRDKMVFKLLMQSLGIPVIKYEWFTKSDWEKDQGSIRRRILKNLSLPVIIKPVNLGSSIGIGTAKTNEELTGSIAAALRFSERIVVESLLKNFREVNCAVFGQGDEILVTEFEEEMPLGDILTFSDKYTDNLRRNFPALVSNDIKDTLRDYSRKIYKCLDFSGTVRMDYLYDETNHHVYMNEINTIAGALSYDLWEGSGRNFTGFLDNVIQESLRRFNGKQNLSYTNEYPIDIVDCCNQIEFLRSN